MSTSKVDKSGVFGDFSKQTELTLTTNSISVRQNGIEFFSPKPMPLWKEMTVLLETPGEAKKLKCTGIVVSCTGTQRVGYTVSILFMDLSRQAQARLELMAGE